MNPKEPEIGPTPREEICRKNKSRLWRYASKRTYRTPLLFVPNLGISRPYIFDLMPRGSFIEYMTQRASTSTSSTGAGSGRRTIASRWSTR